MTLICYKGKRATTWGFRFWHRGKLVKQMVGRSKDLAREAEKRERRKLEQGAFERRWGSLKPTFTPWPEAIQKYLAAKASKRDLKHDEWRLRWWKNFLLSQKVYHLQDLDPEQIDAAKAALAREGKSAATVQRYLAVLRHLCQLAVRRWGLLSQNPVMAVDWPKAVPPDYPVPTVEDVWRLVKEADAVLGAMILAASHTGLRKTSVLRLSTEDLAVRPGWIKGSDRKGNKTVWIPVTPTLKRALGGLGVVSGRLFRKEDGQPFGVFPEERWKTAKTAAGLPGIRFQDLRHCVGTLLAHEGVPQRIVQEWLGHASGRVTERYTRPLETGLVEAARRLERASRRQSRTSGRTRKRAKP